MQDNTHPKIYFAGAIRAGRDLQPTYAAIVAHLKAAGCTVLTEQVASATVEEDERGQPDTAIYMQDIARLIAADALVAEVTVPSLGVGYEIAYALHVLERPVLGLCRLGANLSGMLTGNSTFGLHIAFYTDLSEALDEIDGFLTALRPAPEFPA